MNGLVWGTTRAEMVLENLDDKTRAYMKEELDFDKQQRGGPYLVRRILEPAREAGLPGALGGSDREGDAFVVR